VCYHHNDWTKGDLKRFAADVAAYRARITDFGAVASAPYIRRRSWQDTLVSTVLHSTRSAKRRLRQTIDRVAGKVPA
jgi:hypothetical protein